VNSKGELAVNHSFLIRGFLVLRICDGIYFARKGH